MLIALLATALAAEANLDLRETVRCTEVAFSRSAERNDPAAFRAFLDPDTRFGTGERIQRGAAAVAEAWLPLLTEGGPAIVWRPDTVEVRDDGLALTHGPFRMLSENEAGEISERWGTFTSVWQRQADGSWRIIFDAGGDVGMTPSDPQRALIETDPGC